MCVVKWVELNNAYIFLRNLIFFSALYFICTKEYVLVEELVMKLNLQMVMTMKYIAFSLTSLSSSLSSSFCLPSFRVRN